MNACSLIHSSSSTSVCGSAFSSNWKLLKCKLFLCFPGYYPPKRIIITCQIYLYMIWDHCNSLCLLNTLMSHQCSCVVQTPFHFDLFFLLKPEPLSGSPLLHSCLYAFILGNLSAVAGFRVYRNNYCVQTSTIPNSLCSQNREKQVIQP